MVSLQNNSLLNQIILLKSNPPRNNDDNRHIFVKFPLAILAVIYTVLLFLTMFK